MRMRKEVFILSIDDILPNRFQPRIKFNEEAILELAESIKKHGVIQPIIVRKIADKYEIIAGERRYKASVLAGRTTIPAIVTDVDDKESAEIALIENVQRQDMTPIEEAISYKKILDMGYLNQSDLAIKIGKTQSTIANKLRLLNLADDVQEALLEEKISERHARSLLKLDKKNQIEILNKIIAERLTVRKTDQVINELLNNLGSDDDSSTQKVIENSQIEVLDFEKEEGNEQMNNNLNNNYNIPTQPIVETPNESVQPQQLNPGFMDIDKIQNQAQDINFNISQSSVIEPQASETPFNPFGSPSTEPSAIAVQSQPVSSMTQFGQINPSELTPAEQEYSNIDVNTYQPVQPVSNQEEQSIQPQMNEIQPQAEEQGNGRFFNIFNNNEPVQNSQDNIFEQSVTENIQDINSFGQSVISNNMNQQTSIQPAQPIFNSTPLDEPMTQQPIIDQPVEEPMMNQQFNPFGAPSNDITPINTYSLTDEQEFKPQPVESTQTQINYDVLPEEKELTPLMQINTQNNMPQVDLKTIINTIRNCVETIEKSGYIVDSEELDFENSYQVTIKIDKK